MSQTHPSPDDAWADSTTQSIGFLWVDLAAFNGFRPHPAQRDTGLHANDLVQAGVLEVPLSRHAHTSVVLIADLKNSVARLEALYAADPHGTLKKHAYIVDGHTRGLTYANYVAGPRQLRCEVFIAADAVAAHRLYLSFDSTLANKTVADSLQSMLRLARISAQSLFVRSGVFRKSLEMAIAVQAGGIDASARARAIETLAVTAPPGQGGIYDTLPHLRLVDYFRDAIGMIDALDLKPDRKIAKLPISPPYIAAYLAILRRDPVDGFDFLTSLCDSQGRLAGNQMDAAYAIHHFDAELKTRQKPANRPALAKDKLIVSLVLNAYTAWRKGSDSWSAHSWPCRSSAILASFDPRLSDPAAASARRAPRTRQDA